MQVGTTGPETAGTNAGHRHGMNTQPAPRLLAATGFLAGVLYFVGGHVLQPSGDPSQGMNDSEIVDWARDSYGALWAGGVVSLVGALLLLVWGLALVDRLGEWSRARLVVDIARASVQLTAGALSIAGIAQVFCGTASMPGEHFDSESFVPVLSILYGNLAASAWCLLAPAAVCLALAGGAPRWLRITSGVLAAFLTVTVALPPISWPWGMLWVFVTSVGLLTASAQRHTDGVVDDSARMTSPGAV
jgi:hypothetical protein